MCEIKENLISKILSQIEDKKEQLGEATVHQYDNGSIINFFNTWDESIAGSKSLPIKIIGKYTKGKKIQIIFSPKGTHVPLHNFKVKKTYVVIKGKINLFFENSEDILLTDFSTAMVEYDVLHGGDTLEDSFVFLIEENHDTSNSPLV